MRESIDIVLLQILLANGVTIVQGIQMVSKLLCVTQSVHDIVAIYFFEIFIIVTRLHI